MTKSKKEKYFLCQIEAEEMEINFQHQQYIEKNSLHRNQV